MSTQGTYNDKSLPLHESLSVDTCPDEMATNYCVIKHIGISLVHTTTWVSWTRAIKLQSKCQDESLL